VTPEKTFAVEYVLRNRRAMEIVSDSVFYFAELGMQEHRSAGLMTAVLEAHGFRVTRGISGFPTAFMAEYGSGAPVLAIHCEYDSNPSNSQLSGVTEKTEIVADAPGHCEGHNVNAGVLVCGALAARYAMERFGLPGTIKVFGAPAEEQLLSRPYFVRDGYFDDVDLAFHDHIYGELTSPYGVMQYAMMSASFTFHGESAHAAMWPWKARDALDAVVLMDMGMAQFREHMMPTMSAHRVISNGGEQPNTIPAKAAVWWYFRDPSAEGARKLFEQAKKIAQGAALMTNTVVEFDVMSAVWPVRCNQTMAEVINDNIAAVGLPDWTAEEEAFARTLQRLAGVREDGLPRTIERPTAPTKQLPASNDSGDVSWKVPMGRVLFPSNVPHVPYHHWTGGAALATTIAHKGALVGAQVLAASLVDFLRDPALVARAKATFRSEIGDVVYQPLIPADQQPPVHLNEAMMEKHRPAMEEHYVKEQPAFSAG
jgi:aminobenzoyl-glutamate utilization protein B